METDHLKPQAGARGVISTIIKLFPLHTLNSSLQSIMCTLFTTAILTEIFYYMIVPVFMNSVYICSTSSAA